jgi:hypothetical protein
VFLVFTSAWVSSDCRFFPEPRDGVTRCRTRNCLLASNNLKKKCMGSNAQLQAHHILFVFLVIGLNSIPCLAALALKFTSLSEASGFIAR